MLILIIMFCDFQKNLTKDCTDIEENCRLDFSYPEGVKEKCVNLTGWLFAGNGIGEVSFRERDRVCPSASTSKSELGRFLQRLTEYCIANVSAHFCQICLVYKD